MAAGTQNNQRISSATRPPNLPTIEHPMSRLGDRKSLNIIGSNRPDTASPRQSATGGGRGARSPPVLPGGQSALAPVDQAWNENQPNLPPLRKEHGKENKRINKHSRMMTWPPAHEQGPGERRAKSAKIPSNVEYSSRHARGPDELIQFLKIKLVSGFHGLRQLFRGHDPQGKGTVSRAAMGQILYPLVGYVTPEDVGKLLQRLDLDKQDSISFDEFIACFRDTEVVQREWLSPIARKEVSAERRKMHPEDHLRDRGRGPIINKCSSAYGNALLKEKCKHSDFDIRKYLAPSCFEPGGVVLAPQLQECLALMGAQLDDEEMEKLWERYDLENTGALDSAWFFMQIGLDGRGRYNPRAQTAPPSRRQKYSKLPSTPQIAEEGEGEIDEAARIPTPPSVGRQLNSRSGPPRVLSTDVMSHLSRKMEQNFNSMLASCEALDQSGNGLLGMDQFRRVLADYGIPMQYVNAEVLLEKCGMRRKDGRVMYKDLLYKYIIRTELGVANRIIMDRNHKFNTRLQTPQGFLTVYEAEAKLVEFLHKDFLRLLGLFREVDIYELNLLTQKDFRDTIEKVFNIRMTKDQVNEILYDYGQEDGLVMYPEFLAAFNKKRYIPFKNHSNHQRPQYQPLDRTQTPPNTMQQRDSPLIPEEHTEAWPQAANQEEDMDTSRPVIGGHKAKKMETRYRSVSEIAATVEGLLKKKGYSVQDSYNKIDPKYTGRLSKTQLHQWLSDMGVVLHPTELQDLWRGMEIARDGLVHYAELFDFFLHRSKRKHISDKEATLRKAKAANQPPPVNRSSAQMKEMIDLYKIPVSTLIDKVRHDVVSNWNALKERLKELDPHGYAAITLPEFQRLAQRFQFRLSNKELERLGASFDLERNGRFHYIQFLHLFVQNKHHTPGNAGNAYHRNFHKITHHTSKGPEEVTVAATFDKIGKKVLGDWKSIRRAFKKADLNGDGHLSVPEFRRILADMKIRISDEDFYHIMSEVDENMDGTISYDEFLAQLMPS